MHSAAKFHTLAEEITTWRRHLHQNPELDFAVHETARFVGDKLASFGINRIETGIAGTGIVAFIQGEGGEGPTIGLRADMDALPIHEATGKHWASKSPGKMHACGHDGHTAMLLGAAKYLARSRNFRGTVTLIFQPAEEVELPSGGLKMVEDGFLDRFGISQVFGMHNWPGIDVGKFAICAGPMMASQDDFDIVVKGRGGHAAAPHLTVDPVVIAAQVIIGLQALVSRSTDPVESLVISVTKLRASNAYNVIADEVELAGTVRALAPALRDFAETQLETTARKIAQAFGGDITYRYRRSVPATVNDSAATALAVRAAGGTGAVAVDETLRPVMGAEDFAYMLQARPGALIFIGNGASAPVHNAAYDFDDAAIQYGVAYWVNVVGAALGIDGG
ncbi:MULTISPECIES: amidohydrolase [unclassified Mesorhizobium]|uniref:amidohydrolase n=1 Tax=unclassified Mesorhizobium TaxID=325217 RepID=UPI000FD3DACA|nr:MULTISPECIES: amidohydrolase [unclassified Mesorhizobium]RUU74067.1 amidohydrolase [Mesorhizobium sp. M7A.F.Ca.MR.362.00.0.0]RWN86223.1 MAG: amidohydrolase [Mesorhizobium sp.]RWO93316.1 MAG: amidohydrolase [Mesorhizobium sp.]TIM49777.1 MAG: amidohydrolase [Mesorhizobium sp.]